MVSTNLDVWTGVTLEKKEMFQVEKHEYNQLSPWLAENAVSKHLIYSWVSGKLPADSELTQ